MELAAHREKIRRYESERNEGFMDSNRLETVFDEEREKLHNELFKLK